MSLLARRKWVILASFALVVAASWLVVAFRPERWTSTATATVVLSRLPPNVRTPTQANTIAESYAEIIGRSPSVLRAVYTGDDARLTTGVVTDTTVMTVRVTAGSSAGAVRRTQAAMAAVTGT